MTLSEYIAEGAALYRANATDRIPGLPSSPAYDAKLITAHVLYWTGKLPRDISTGRGHSYNVLLGSTRYSVRITDYRDHRHGVAGLHACTC